MAEKRHFPLFAILLIVAIGTSAFIVINLVSAIFNVSTNDKENDIRNWVSLTIESGIGIFIAMMVLYYDKLQQQKSDEQQKEISRLVIKIKEFEEKQKEFLDELEKTRTARISFYGTKLITDFRTIQKYFDNVEKLPNEQLHKLDPAFFARNNFAHVITINVGNENVEIPNIQFFNVMKQDLQIIESDLPPEISYFAGKTIELAQFCFIPMGKNITVNDNLWKMTKDDIETAISRLDSLVSIKKTLKEYGLRFVRTNATIKLD